jgi:hypothetical protein
MVARRTMKTGKKRTGKTATVTLTGERASRGERMTSGAGWHLMRKKGRKRVFLGTLIDTVNAGSVRLAIFRVPK